MNNKSKKYFTKTNKRSNKKSTKRRRNKGKGGNSTMSFGLGGVPLFSKYSGDKMYNWKTGNWDDRKCYGIGTFTPLKI